MTPFAQLSLTAQVGEGALDHLPLVLWTGPKAGSREAVCPWRKWRWASLEHVPGSTERQVKCLLEPWPPLFLSTCLGSHSPVTSRSGSVLERVLCAAWCPGIPMLGFTQGLWGLDAISELLGN